MVQNMNLTFYDLNQSYIALYRPSSGIFQPTALVFLVCRKKINLGEVYIMSEISNLSVKSLERVKFSTCMKMKCEVILVILLLITPLLYTMHCMQEPITSNILF